MFEVGKKSCDGSKHLHSTSLHEHKYFVSLAEYLSRDVLDDVDDGVL